jgi:hypothetical protein
VDYEPRLSCSIIEDTAAQAAAEQSLKRTADKASQDWLMPTSPTNSLRFHPVDVDVGNGGASPGTHVWDLDLPDNGSFPNLEIPTGPSTFFDDCLISPRSSDPIVEDLGPILDDSVLRTYVNEAKATDTDYDDEEGTSWLMENT